MKKLILLLILFNTTFMFSFNSGINYQAVLRDSQGNILSNQSEPLPFIQDLSRPWANCAAG